MEQVLHGPKRCRHHLRFAGRRSATWKTKPGSHALAMFQAWCLASASHEHVKDHGHAWNELAGAIAKHARRSTRLGQSRGFGLGYSLEEDTRRQRSRNWWSFFGGHPPVVVFLLVSFKTTPQRVPPKQPDLNQYFGDQLCYQCRGRPKRYMIFVMDTGSDGRLSSSGS